MAEINNDAQDNPKRKHHKLISKKMSPRVDLTPMVDLAFLLIAFFMLTTSLQKSKAMEWDKRISSTKPEPVPDCVVLNILVDTLDRVYTYGGTDINSMKLSSDNTKAGLIKSIAAKQVQVKKTCEHDKYGNARDVICLVKLLPGSRYQNMVDALDNINYLKISTYSIIDPTNEEIELVKKKGLKI